MNDKADQIPTAADPTRQPWAYVCRKGRKFGGVISPTQPCMEAAEFLAGFIADGYEIVTVFDRPEYLTLLEGLDG